MNKPGASTQKKKRPASQTNGGFNVVGQIIRSKLITDYSPRWTEIVKAMIKAGEPTLPMHIAYRLGCKESTLLDWAQQYPEFESVYEASLQNAKIKAFDDLINGRGDPKNLNFINRIVGTYERDVEKLLTIKEKELATKIKPEHSDRKSIDISFTVATRESVKPNE